MVTVIDIQSVALDRARGDIFVVELRFESSLAYRLSSDMGSASFMSHSMDQQGTIFRSISALKCLLIRHQSLVK